MQLNNNFIKCISQFEIYSNQTWIVSKVLRNLLSSSKIHLDYIYKEKSKSKGPQQHNIIGSIICSFVVLLHCQQFMIDLKWVLLCSTAPRKKWAERMKPRWNICRLGQQYTKRCLSEKKKSFYEWTNHKWLDSLYDEQLKSMHYTSKNNDSINVVKQMIRYKWEIKFDEITNELNISYGLAFQPTTGLKSVK